MSTLNCQIVEWKKLDGVTGVRRKTIEEIIVIRPNKSQVIIFLLSLSGK